MSDDDVPRITDDALKHGVPLPDIEHAYRQRVRSFDEPDMLMWVGPARNGALLEVGIGSRGEIVHSLPARPKYVDALTKPRKRRKR